jgi:hypothetical protein
MVKSLEMQVDDLQFELDADNRMTFYNNQKVTPAPLEAEASQKQALTIINNYIQND